MKIVSCFIFILWVAQLFAHDLYLRPSSFELKSPGRLNLSMELVEKFFPGDKLEWRGEKTSMFKLLGPSGEQELTTPPKTDPVLDLKMAGTYVIGWEGTPSFVELKPDEFNTYLQLEGYKNVLELRTKLNAENQAGKEKYSRSLKTIVQSGSKQTHAFSKPLGLKIEIVPLENPYAVRPGSELKVKLLFEGQPLAGKKIMATHDTYSKKPEDYAHVATTDLEGVAAFNINKPGIWMIRANHMLPLQNDPQADWHSFWANCTFEIR